jgi:hypothetical protein
VKKAFPAEVRAIRDTTKEIEKTWRAQCVRLEGSLVIAREMKVDHWRRYFLEHALLGFIGRKLIWVFRKGGGAEQAALWFNGKMCDASGATLEVGEFEKVRLWHPLSTDASETQRWRELVFKNKIHQPFRQAFREFYQGTEDERETRLYSNRFAGILMPQHQLASLCRERGWEYRLMGANFDGVNAPTKQLDDWKIHAEFLVDIPSDRQPSLRNSAAGEQSGSGINLFVGSDQVRFYRESREIAIDEVPALVYLEIMRDVDLFTSVCTVGDDETWSGQGDRGTGIILERSNVGGAHRGGVAANRFDLASAAADADRRPLQAGKVLAGSSRPSGNIPRGAAWWNGGAGQRQRDPPTENSAKGPERSGFATARSARGSRFPYGNGPAQGLRARRRLEDYRARIDEPADARIALT